MTDVLIAGGGPAGLAAAIALAERGIRVAVVDPSGGISPHRGELLPQGASQILNRLGLGDFLQSTVVIEDVVSQWGSSPQAHGGQPSLGLHGWGIDRRELSEAMVWRAHQLDVSILKGQVKSPRKTADGWLVSMQDDEIRPRYLIDATGRRAGIARRHGARALHGTELVALTWQARDRGPAKMLAEATADGWWYSVPFKTGRTLGFMTDAQNAKQISGAPDTFLANARRGSQLISLHDLSSESHLMDSRSAVLDRLTGPGWLATGDAAASFDPIASQGLFNALSAGFFAGKAAADVLAGDAEAALVFEALVRRTAERTHGMTHLQYAAMPFDTAFWRCRSNPVGAAVGVRPVELAFSAMRRAQTTLHPDAA